MTPARLCVSRNMRRGRPRAVAADQLSDPPISPNRDASPTPGTRASSSSRLMVA
jgi:hypothetical protein